MSHMLLIDTIVFQIVEKRGGGVYGPLVASSVSNISNCIKFSIINYIHNST